MAHINYAARGLEDDTYQRSSDRLANIMGRIFGDVQATHRQNINNYIQSLRDALQYNLLYGRPEDRPMYIQNYQERVKEATLNPQSYSWYVDSDTGNIMPSSVTAANPFRTPQDLSGGKRAGEEEALSPSPIQENPPAPAAERPPGPTQEQARQYSEELMGMWTGRNEPRATQPLLPAPPYLRAKGEPYLPPNQPREFIWGDPGQIWRGGSTTQSANDLTPSGVTSPQRQAPPPLQPTTQVGAPVRTRQALTPQQREWVLRYMPLRARTPTSLDLPNTPIRLQEPVGQ